MEDIDELLKAHPNYRLLGKVKFVARLAEHNIPRADARKYFDGLEIGQLYAPKKRKGRLVITAPPYSYQIDVIEMPRFKASNNGIVKFFLAVDILSRKAFAYPLKSGRMKDVLDAYEKLIIDSDEPINSVAGDAFFDNESFKAFNEEMITEVYTDVAKDDHMFHQGDKLGIVDRLTRTLKKLISKFMQQHNSTRWSKFLPEILELYNNDVHSSLKGHSPNEVFDDFDYMISLYHAQHKRNADVTSDIKPGDTVRLMVGKDTFGKEGQTYSRELYRVLAQVGYRYVIEGKRRKYRASELMEVKPVTHKMKEGPSEKVKVEGKAKVARNVDREMRRLAL